LSSKGEHDLFYLYTKFEDSSFSRSSDMIGPKKCIWVTWRDQAPYQDLLPTCQIWCLYLHPLRK